MDGNLSFDPERTLVKLYRNDLVSEERGDGALEISWGCDIDIDSNSFLIQLTG